MRRLSLTPLTLAACLLAGMGFFALTSAPRAADAPAATAARPTLTVQTQPPERATLAQSLTANGNLAAWQEASIGAESNGLRLAEVRVNVGDSVKAGQVLAVFAADMVQAEVAQARASLLEAQAHAAEAASNAERARTLQATGALSAQQIEQYTTAAQAAQARVEAAQALLKVQQLRLKHTQVLAPDSGVISARSATVGAVVGAGTELFRMVRKGRLEWRAEVTASELARLHPGTPAQLTAASGASVQGTVRMVAPTVDAQTRNALVYVDVPAHPQLRAGMFARGSFALGESSALTVPQEALVVRDGFSYLFVLGTDQRVARTKVQPGRRVGERVEITSPLDERAQVVVRGAGFLNDGDLVRVATGTEKLEEKPTAAPINKAQPAIK